MNRSFLALAITIAVSACQDATAPRASSPSEPAVNHAGGAAIDLPAFAGRLTAGHGFSGLQDGESSGDVTCVGLLLGGVYENVTVPPGGACTVAFAEVRGNIKALQDATLLVLESRVGGSIIGDKADVMQLRRNVVEGNIEIAEGGPHPVFLEVGLCGNDLPNGNIKIIKMQGGVGVSPFAFCQPATPNNVRRGNLQIEDNLFEVPTKRLFVSQNQVGQNLQVYKNRGWREKLVFSNTAGESVQCFDNDPPFVGGPNAAPKREGQCF